MPGQLRLGAPVQERRVERAQGVELKFLKRAEPGERRMAALLRAWDDGPVAQRGVAQWGEPRQPAMEVS